jgi:hypothetical protein
MGIFFAGSSLFRVDLGLRMKERSGIEAKIRVEIPFFQGQDRPDYAEEGRVGHGRKPNPALP